ncbi:winged helix-turn-helix domain-containing protein [Falsirhodobacter sp. 20TX0035]|uniref:winged helix-turn-helix domain-containing protein n=1 Tax=Falsirhodobacter sp. 20TX0035 TaxID=3022019 RepID=UPI00232B501D|nr:winged helix-turn-helix domain-containing protein [Falsirhodobacter sp. 20TX0035]
MALPAAERLPFALELLQQLTGQSADDVVRVRKQLGVSKKHAQMLLALNAAFPRTLTKEQVMTAIHGPGWEQDIRSVTVMAAKIREKHPDLIETVWGTGYRLTRKLDVGMDPVAGRENAGDPWTEQDDEDLRRMMENGSELHVIADEMDRSERSVADRWRRIRGRKA